MGEFWSVLIEGTGVGDELLNNESACFSVAVCCNSVILLAAGRELFVDLLLYRKHHCPNENSKMNDDVAKKKAELKEPEKDEGRHTPHHTTQTR